MKPKHIRGLIAIFLLIVLIYFAWNINSLPNGIFEAGHCGNVSKNSEVCWCDNNEIKTYENFTYKCEINQSVKK